MASILVTQDKPSTWTVITMRGDDPVEMATCTTIAEVMSAVATASDRVCALAGNGML